MNPTNVTLRDDAVYLIDGSGYIFRAYYAIRPLNTSKGVPTNAVYGFTTMLLKLLKEHRPKYVAIAFDTKEPTFRHKLYDGYKANRPPPPADLIPQFALIHRVCDALQIPKLIVPGFEADDLIGTLAKRIHAAGQQVVIVTGDKDLMQLVNHEIFLLDELRATKTGTELFIDEKEVTNKFGVPPNRVIDVLALMGDASDNVPGVKGIGEKTAIELIKEYGSLESVLNSATMMSKARRDRLMEGYEMAKLSKQLVTIDTNANIDISLDTLKTKGPDKAAARELFAELEFKRLAIDPLFADPSPLPLAGRGQGEGGSPTIDRTKYRSITSTESLQEIVSLLSSHSRIAIDTETNSLDPLLAKLVGISLCWSDNQACYIPVGHDPTKAPTQLPLSQVIEALNPILQDPTKTIIAQNAKFDQEVLTRAGFTPFRIGGDPMLANYLLHADTARHSLDEMSRVYLDHSTIPFEEVCGKGKNQITFDQVAIEPATLYAAEDADIAYRLANILEAQLQTENLDDLYRNMELPLEQVLTRMEQRGVQIDTALLGQMSSEFDQILRKLEKEAHELAGTEFNLASPKQVADILFGKMQLESGRKTKTGLSTDSSVLEELAISHPLPKLLLEHRMIAKLKGTYVDALPLLVNPETGRVHTSFNQAVAATGRLSSSDPNLQNIPIRTPEGRRIREAFVARDGCVIISLDYSQIELRILASISEDPVMVDAFKKGEDVHARTASEIFGVPLAQVTKEQRYQAKTINFGLLYGMGAHRLAQTLGISRADAMDYLNRYYERYSGIYAWQNRTLEQARKDKQVRTLFGRRRKLPEITSHNRGLVQRAERMAINTPIQGTAADLIKKAMIETDATLQNELPDVHLILQVHDELLLEAPVAQAEQAKELVRGIMTRAKGIFVPIVVDAGQGRSWAEAH